MFISIESSDSTLLERVYTKVEGQKPLDRIITDPIEALNFDYVPGSTTHIVTSLDIENIEFKDVASERWAHLRLASLGARFWAPANKPTTQSPIYSSKALSGSSTDLDTIVVDAVYAEGKAAYVQSLGVNYVGRTYVDPRTIVLVDYKGDKTHDPDRDQIVHDILTSLPNDRKPESAWGAFGIVSTSNTDRLGDFLAYMEETNILSYSPGGLAKLRHLGRDYGEVGQPNSDRAYGVHLRETSARLHIINAPQEELPA